MREIVVKYYSDQTKSRYELATEPENQCNIIFTDAKLAVKVIVNCRTTSAHKFRTKLGFKLYYFILTKEQSVLTRIMSSFEGGNMQTQ